MALQIDYNKQSQIKQAIEIAISYCEEHIPTTDSWSRQGLESLLINFKDLNEGIGNSFVIASDPN